MGVVAQMIDRQVHLERERSPVGRWREPGAGSRPIHNSFGISRGHLRRTIEKRVIGSRYNAQENVPDTVYVRPSLLAVDEIGYLTYDAMWPTSRFKS